MGVGGVRDSGGLALIGFADTGFPNWLVVLTDILKKILDYVGKAAKQGASLCTFPEFMMFYTKASQTPEQLANMAESIHGNFVTKIADAAKQNSIMDIGTLYEKSAKKNFLEQNGEKHEKQRKTQKFWGTFSRFSPAGEKKIYIREKVKKNHCNGITKM